MNCTILLTVALCGCNFADDVVFNGTTSNNNNNINNNPNSSNNNMGDMGGGGGDPVVTITNVMANGSALPTQIPSQSGTFSVTGDVTAANSAECGNCNIQVVVGLSDGSSMGCLHDGPATSGAVSGTVDLEAAATVGTQELVWGGFELADCDAALAAASSLGESLGEVEFTDPPALAVIAITPGNDEADVIVDTTIRISFDAPLDQASVTGRAQLSGPAGIVQTTVDVMGDEIILTPQNPLNEFQTVYTVNVTAGITGSGRALDADVTSTFRTRMFVPDQFYAASDEFHGVGFSLGIDAANQCVMMPADDTAAQQRFRFVPRDGGWIAYNSRAIAAARALDGGDGAGNCFMNSLGATPAPSQVWQFFNQPSGAVVMGNQRFGMAQSLDATGNPPATGADPPCAAGSACPLMQPTTSINRQFWRWRRLQ